MALPQIKPKQSKESNLALLSQIHVSKNWKLPPRLPQRANQQRKRPHQLQDEYGPEENEEELQKKKRQNRDAQRAYRERKNNKLQVLEDTIESLSKVVKNYEAKLSRLQRELQERDSENHALKMRLDALSPKQACVPAQDPILQTLIDNFQPMKAIPMKYNAAAAKRHRHSNELPNSAKCGFCSDNTTCVCKELETDSGKADDDAAVAVQKGMSPPPHPQCNNKGNPVGLCSDCTNIDKSCIDIRSIIH
ncbi:Yap5p SKDI_09G1820 [Saccharomyces kudriavzevii IFO 1802]|uniref:BZIP domain-containing protein n=1 Tax=Saccharomyces kudriavzevii (strain ATCC MYA-4449 / AS 2.2408 / CBS 8840 / NBRC 1802 / NCYC 2889) TaxID=226230 RepID=A0AA35JMT0_SACK1|nr:uncharacterized protein SKDI_09G1820 [Saccharomyces kudriavzevii IFO 1802]CAI4064971.1 hypothetical protein SKDI_09G1820 [Saccharomyces kudriavzevii IFO 1802]